MSAAKGRHGLEGLAKRPLPVAPLLGGIRTGHVGQRTPALPVPVRHDRRPLADLQARLGLSYLLISHDIAVVEHMCDRVGVMYLGVLVETGPVEKVLGRPLHPYTQALIGAVPVPDPHRRTMGTPLEGDVPDPSSPPPGCRFWPRCLRAEDGCRREVPVLRLFEPDHEVACHLA